MNTDRAQLMSWKEKAFWWCMLATETVFCSSFLILDAFLGQREAAQMVARVLLLIWAVLGFAWLLRLSFLKGRNG